MTEKTKRVDYGEYLRDRTLTALENKGLIENNRAPVFYKIEEAGLYRRARQWAALNFNSIGLAGVAGACVAAYLKPELMEIALKPKVIAGIGIVSILGFLGNMFLPLDNLLFYNPKDVAKRFFKNRVVEWKKAYNSLNIRTRGELEGCVLMAQNPDAIRGEFTSPDNRIAFGVYASKTADTLSKTNHTDTSVVSGISLKQVINMITRQKTGTEEEVEAIAELKERYSDAQIASLLKKAKKGNLPKIDKRFYSGLSALSDFTSRYEFALKIPEAGMSKSIGSQMRRGLIAVDDDVGSNTGAYAGKHSKGLELPRFYIKDDVARSFLTHSRRAFGYVGGNAEQGVLDDSKGGVVVVRGKSEHDFARDATDIRFPLIGICIGGLEDILADGHMKNGMIVSLNTKKELDSPPSIYIFKDKKMQTIRLEDNGHQHERAAEEISIYIQGWEPGIAA